jgi:hypothetical protein
LIALMRYQTVPERDLPAQLACHAVPVTPTMTATLVPVGMLTVIGALDDALVRRFAVHRADFVTAAPNTSPGAETEVTAKAKIAANSAVVSTAGSDA